VRIFQGTAIKKKKIKWGSFSLASLFFGPENQKHHSRDPSISNLTMSLHSSIEATSC